MDETIADWIVQFLDEQKIEFVFSHPGGPVLPIYDSMRRLGIPKNVLVRHEGAGSFMADAYAKVTGKVGVCMSTMGPGAANMTIGVGTAMSDSTPVLAITGQMKSSSIGRGYQQETDHRALFSGITKGSFQLKQAENAREVVQRAYKLAISGRPGPVHIDIPFDISSQRVSSQAPTEVVRVLYGPARHEDVESAARLIQKATRPLILAGGGAIISNASKEVTQFAEFISSPVSTSYNGRGAIPEDHPLSIGRSGEYTPSYCRKLVSSADLLIAIGYRFTDVSTEGWKPAEGVKIIQIDIDPTSIGVNIPVDVPLIGDAGYVLSAIRDQLRKDGATQSRKKWTRSVSEERQRWRSKYDVVQNSDAVPIKPQRVIKELAKVLNENSIVVAGAGRAKMWAASMLPIIGPRTWIHSGGYAVMGYELAAALAAKMARPKAQVIAVGGDASFQMHCQELATAVEYGAPFLAVVLNDMKLASIRNAQLSRYGADFGTEFSLDVDLGKVATSFGAFGARITKPSELEPAIRDALDKDRPTVLDVVIDGAEMPTFDL